MSETQNNPLLSEAIAAEVVATPETSVQESTEAKAEEISSPNQISDTTENEPISLEIDEGIVTKRGPLPLRLWQKRLLTSKPFKPSFPLYELRIAYRKCVKKSQASKEEFEKLNRLLFDSIATATVNASDFLFYYKPNNKDLPQGLINLRHITSVEAAPKIKPLAFLIKTKLRDYVFCAASASELNAWLHTLKAKLEAEIPDYSDTQGYKASYESLISRKGFLPPASSAQNDEVFSASEAEFEPSDIPLSGPSDPVPEPQQDIVDKPGTIEAQPAASKSFFNEVLGRFYPKTNDIDSDIKTNADVNVAEEVVSKASIDPKPETEVANVEPEAQPEVEVVSNELANAQEVSPASDSSNRPTRSKTFSNPFQSTKLFSIFSKAPKEDKVAKEPIVEESQIPQEASAIVDTEPESSEKIPSASIEEPQLPEESQASDKAEKIEVSTSPSEEKPKERSIPFFSNLLSRSKSQKASSPAEATEAEEPKVSEAPVEAIPIEEVKSDVILESEPVNIKPKDEDSRPFLQRLLSNGRKDNADSAKAVEDSVSEAVAPQANPEKKQGLFNRFLGGKTKPTPEAVIDEDASSVPAKTDIQPEAIPESIQTELATDSKPIEAELPLNDASEKIESPEVVNETSGSEAVVKSDEIVQVEESIAENVAVDAKIKSGVSESAPVEASVEKAPSSDLAENSTAGPVEEDNRPFIVRVLSGKRKPKKTSDDTLPEASEATSELATSEQVEEPVPEPISIEEAPQSTLAEEPTPNFELSPEASKDSKVEEVEYEEDTRPFLARVLSGKRKPKMVSPGAEEATPVPELVSVEKVATETEDTTTHPIEDATPVESVEQVKEAVAEPALAEEPQGAAPLPVRNASLITRIGEYAYSAVSPTLPEDINEELDEHYQLLAQSAIHSGFLFKQSYLLHSYNHRFVILTSEGQFVYFRSSQVVSDGKKILVDESVVIEKLHETAFVIKSSSQSLTFFAKTQAERDQWIEAFANFAKKIETADVKASEVEAKVPIEATTDEPKLVTSTKSAEETS